MNHDIKYNGYTTNPSDYASPDGDLNLAFNVINEDGALQPIKQPKKVLSLQNGERILFVHTVNEQENYILARGKLDYSFELFYLKKEDGVVDTSDAKHIMTMNEFCDIDAVGNSLIIATKSGMQYLVWKDGKYLILGQKPPFISIGFTMRSVNAAGRKVTQDIPHVCTYEYQASGRSEEPSDADLTSISDIVYGLINAAISERISSRNLFYQPFFVRYAYRMFDGSLNWHSAPVLMLPTTLVPRVNYSANGDTATFFARVMYYMLFYQIIGNDIEKLENWRDIISGIDIFISAPIYTYDVSTNLSSPLYSDNDVPHVGTSSATYFTGHSSSASDGGSYNYASSSKLDSPVVNIKINEAFESDILSTHTFYKVKEFKLDDIKAMDFFDTLPLDVASTDVATLSACEVMSDEYQSHSSLIAKSLYAYNSRLNMADVSLAPTTPFPLSSCVQVCDHGENADGSSGSAVNPSITVWSRINGTKVKSTLSDTSLANAFLDCDKYFPRFIYYPDASAYKMEIYISDEKKYIIPLTPHNFLNGAYYYNSDYSDNPIPENINPETDECATSVDLPNKIYTSEVNNPFYFPASYINTVGYGKVLGISTAAKALSQGQFGQFPLYAFTSEGVWALEVTSTGVYSAKQPITRDVCINHDSITQLDSAVLFATARGIMLISGSETQCISDIINSEAPFSINNLPAAAQIVDIYNSKAAALQQVAINDITILPFLDFIDDCRIVYDYVHQHVIVYNPVVRYSYVYSLKSKSWGMMYADFVYSVNSYPEALVVTNDNQLVDFSQTVADTAAALVVTRPFKIDSPDTFKTINTVIQRGMFRHNHVAQVLYGSNDLYNWHTVWSSVNRIMRGFRGTPYKTYRLALIANFDKAESLYGCSIDFMPRLTNQIR